MDVVKDLVVAIILNVVAVMVIFLFIILFIRVPELFMILGAIFGMELKIGKTKMFATGGISGVIRAFKGENNG